MTNEEKAEALGWDKTKLRKRLMDAKTVLVPELKQKFKNATFNFKAKQLVGDGCVLQWKTHQYPTSPESYENQQTNIGIVVFLIDK